METHERHKNSTGACRAREVFLPRRTKEFTREGKNVKKQQQQRRIVDGGVEQIEVMNINSTKPIPFVSLALSHSPTD
jgi:hypothetical protein